MLRIATADNAPATVGRRKMHFMVRETLSFTVSPFYEEMNKKIIAEIGREGRL